MSSDVRSFFVSAYIGASGWARAIELATICTRRADDVDAVRISPSVRHTDPLAYRAVLSIDLCYPCSYRACSKCTSHIIAVEVEHSSTSFANFFSLSPSLYLAYAIVSISAVAGNHRSVARVSVYLKSEFWQTGASLSRSDRYMIARESASSVLCVCWGDKSAS